MLYNNTYDMYVRSCCLLPHCLRPTPYLLSSQAATGPACTHAASHAMPANGGMACSQVAISRRVVAIV